MQVRDGLMELGLSRYEADVFIHLVQEGVSEVRAVQRGAGVPSGRVYDVLNSLVDKGMVEVQESRPKKYAAKGIDLALQKVYERKEAAMRDELRRSEQLVETLQKELAQMAHGTQKGAIFWTSHVGAEAFVKTLESIFAEPTREVRVIPPPAARKLVPHVAQKISEALAKGVRINMLTTRDFIPFEYVEDSDVISRIAPHLNLRLADSVDAHFAVIDEEKVVIPQADPLQTDEMLSAVKIWNREKARQFRERFDALWEKAEPVDVEAYVRDA